MTINLKWVVIIGLPIMVALRVSLYYQSHNQSDKPAEKPSGYTIDKQISYSFTLTNNTSERLTHQTFRVYAPVQKTASQQVQALKSSHHYQLITDKFNNQIMVFTLAEFAPLSNRQITIKAHLKMAETPNRQAEENISQFLSSAKHLNLSDTTLIELSKELKHKENSTSTLNAYQWAINNIRDSGYQASALNVSELLKQRSGDCTEYMYILTAINRLNNIPTREVAGYIVPESKILKSSEYHNWAESYLDGRWLLSDAQNKKHHQLHQDYVAFRHYGNDPVNPLQDVHRYNVSDPRIRVQMN